MKDKYFKKIYRESVASDRECMCARYCVRRAPYKNHGSALNLISTLLPSFGLIMTRS